MIKNLIIIFSLLLISTFSLKADVPPDDGYVRVRINLVTETQEDLTDYRFFIDFNGDLREVDVKSKGRSEISPMGGGARYSSGTFFAIPKKSLKDFEEKISGEQAGKLSRLISTKEIEGVVELAQHSFSRDVPKGEKAPEIYYVIKREANTLKAERISDEKPKANPSASTVLSTSRASYIIAGILIALAVFATGIFAFRKASKKV